MRVCIHQARANGKQTVVLEDDDGAVFFRHRIHIDDALEREQLLRLAPQGAGRTTQDIREALEQAIEAFESEIVSNSSAERLESPEYHVANGRIYFAADGERGLTNFEARIAEEKVILGDENPRRFFRIEGRTDDGQELSPIWVSANEFESMNWLTTHWGASAVIRAGRGVRDHVRAAILHLSRARSIRYVYSSLGWHRINDEWIYLCAGGAITPRGFSREFEVELPKELSRFQLSELPAHNGISSIQACLQLLRIAPPTIIAPLLGATFRAVCGDVDFVVHLHGPTGTFKSSLAAIFQQHFGALMDAGNLPLSWASTANFIESTLHFGKDALNTIDDYAPGGTSSDVSRQNKTVMQVVRAVGNRQGRQRLGADLGFIRTREPRGLVLSTGEAALPMHSITSRGVQIEVGRGDVSVTELTMAQTRAAAGHFAECLALFIRDFASHYDVTQNQIVLVRRDLRSRFQAQQGGHARTPRNLAELMLGIHMFLDFAVRMNAVSQQEALNLTQLCFAALVQVANHQRVRQLEQDQAIGVLRFARTAMSMGQAYLDIRGRAPATCADFGNSAEGPRGLRIGVLHNGEEIYFYPNSLLQIAKKLAAEQGSTINISQRELAKQLNDARLLSREESQHSTFLSRAPGERNWCLKIMRQVLEEIY